MAIKHWIFYGLTGGAAGDLDAISHTVLTDLDIAVGVESAVSYTYQYDDDSVLAEDSPNVIAPDSGTGRWILQTAYSLVGTKTGTFTRDVAAATGDVGYTGVGFKPGALVLVGGLSTGATNLTVFGISNQVSTYGLDHVAGTWYLDGSPNLLVRVDAGTNYVVFVIKSFDADGFTLTYTKTGNPTGTVSFGYLALR